MKNIKNYSPYICIVIAAVLWGNMSIFVNVLGMYGFGSMQIVCVRASVAAVVLGLFLLMKDKRLFRIKLRDLPIFFGTGVISFACFSYCYFTAMHLCSVSVAAVLLYTAPAFVMILSAVFFKEKLTAVKIISVIITIIGCALVTGMFGGSAKISSTGILFGLGAGIGYALYSIFGRYGINKYDTLTVTFYTFAFAAIATLPFVIISGSSIVIEPKSIMWMIGAGIFTSVLPYLLYTYGLTGVESGRASVIATIEPVVASVIGVCVFDEYMGIVKIIGIALVFAAVVMVNIKQK